MTLEQYMRYEFLQKDYEDLMERRIEQIYKVFQDGEIDIYWLKETLKIDIRRF